MDTVLAMAATLRDLPTTFTTQDAREFGLYPVEISRLLAAGDLLELSRDVFRRADAPVPSRPDLLAVAHRVPNAIICCVTALQVYDLTDDIPTAVQIGLPREQRKYHVAYPPIEVFRFNADTFEVDLSFVEVAPGEHARIYSAERTVVDVVRLRKHLGEPLALAALRRYLSRPDARPGHLLSLARTLNIFGPLRIALDTVNAG